MLILIIAIAAIVGFITGYNVGATKGYEQAVTDYKKISAKILI